MRASGAALALAVASVAAPVAASAQTTHVATPEERVAFQQRADAQTKLAGALSRIAQDGRNGFALLDAGEAALALNDPQAALGFLARAENALPREGRVKSALGAAMMVIGRYDQALRYFGEAEAGGARERTYLGERALAYDLSGDSASAQRDYRAALTAKPGDATLTRNYALSLGIAGNSQAALAMLNPLLARQDRASWRARAFILAMNGQAKEAGETVDAVMPANLARDIKPYLARMDDLTPPQKAAAAHFGKFPTGPLAPSPVRVASADTRSPAAARTARPTRAERNAARRAAREQAQREKTARAVPPAVRAASRTPTPPLASRDTPVTNVAPSPQIVPQTQPQQASPSVVVKSEPPASARPAVTQAAQSIATAQLPPSSAAQPGFTVIDPAKPSSQPTLPAAQAITIPPRAVPSAASPTVYGPSVTIDLPPEQSLFDIVNAIDVPVVAERPIGAALSASELERTKQETLAAQAAEEKREAAEKAKALTAAKAKQEADAKAKQEADAKKAEKLAKAANPARHWVQVATGANIKALAFDYRRMAKKYPDLFKGQDGWTSAWGRTQRLVVGPFGSLKDAKTWDADYRKAGGDAFVWSSTDGLEVEKLGGK